jgi:hypothetical protein
MALGINVEHFVPYIYTQNGLAKSLIKRIKWIARPLLSNFNLPTSCWGHAVLHATDLIQIKPTTYGFPVAISMLKSTRYFMSTKISCIVYIPISPSHRTSMAPIGNWGYMWVQITVNWGYNVASVDFRCCIFISW